MVREQYKTTFGPKLKKVLEMQKKVIKEYTYDIVNASDYEAGEIIADKVLKQGLI